MEHTDNYPQDLWTLIHTDGSAEQPVKNGGVGIYVKYQEEERNDSLAIGLYSTNFKAEAVIQTGAAHIKNSPDTPSNVADALSILQDLQTAKDKELNGLTFSCRAHTVVLQLIPSHCGVLG